ncbi:MAG: glycosyltransferase family 2 protein, partial [Oscillospiraceae bacterium]|nr:glycosyltransferase family 2 protein [Oscillospiraceae bacterium]
RAHTLPRAFEALKEQSCKDFIWLIVDDGSTDNTKELVESFQKEDCGFQIEYIYKKNGGMHTAHNVAYQNIKTELNTCIDSDDMIGEEAVKKILDFWNEKGSEKYAGLLGYDTDFDGNVIGKGFPKGLETTTLSSYYRNGGSGDKKLVLRTDIVNQYPPYPEYEGEKLVPLGTLYTLIDQDYEMRVLDEPLCRVEYQPDGSGASIFRQYKQSPRGFMYSRIMRMQYAESFTEAATGAIHYISSCIFAKERHFLKKSPKKLLTVLAIPFGVLLNIYIRLKISRQK